MIKEINLEHKNEELLKFVERFTDLRVAVIGDIMLDEYIWGKVSRISPEAPVPVVEIKGQDKRLGGSANVVNNISALGGRSILCGVVGEDEAGKEIIDTIKGLGLTTEGIIVDPVRNTSVKSRVVAHSQQVVRFDRETKDPIDPEQIQIFLSFLKRKEEELDAVIVADYGKGVITSELMKGLRNMVIDSDIIIAVDPKTDHFEYYNGINIITPNHYEAGAFCGFDIVDQETLLRAGEKMIEELSCKSVLITQGKEGMTLFEETASPSHISTNARKVFDVSGAGDTVIGALCLGLASGMERESAAAIANFAAGVVVEKLGTSVVTAEELKRVINEYSR